MNDQAEVAWTDRANTTHKGRSCGEELDVKKRKLGGVVVEVVKQNLKTSFKLSLLVSCV